MLATQDIISSTSSPLGLSGAQFRQVKLDLRHQYIVGRIRDYFVGGDNALGDKLSAELEKRIGAGDDEFQLVHEMINGLNNVNHLLFLYQPGDGRDEDCLLTFPDAEKERNGGRAMQHIDISNPVTKFEHENILSVIDPSKGAKFVLKKRAIMCVRSSSNYPIPEKDYNAVVQELYFTPIEHNFLHVFSHLIHEVFTPLLSKSKDWGENKEFERQSYLDHLVRYAEHLEEIQTHSKEIDFMLVSIDETLWKQIRHPLKEKKGGTSRAKGIKKLVIRVEEHVIQWAEKINAELRNAPNYELEIQAEEAGPKSEQELWKKRLAQLELVKQELLTVQAERAAKFLQDVNSPVVDTFDMAVGSLLEDIKEAKDNVKYLTSLDRFFDVLYTGTPRQIMAMLPAVINNIKMVYMISRYYSTRERMTALFFKMTNQMIVVCKLAINPTPHLFSHIWDLASNQTSLCNLLYNLQVCLELNKAYIDEYRAAQKSLAAKMGSKQFDFEELKFIGHFNLFAKRVDKLINVFKTIQQFMLLKSYNIDSMEPLLVRFDEHLASLKSKTQDVLNVHDNNKFDTEYKNFEAQIMDLETSLQVAINSSFENITSTEDALNLLKKLQAILQAETFQADLNSKYMVIFHNYGLELETDQKTYEKHKSDPPIVRNITPVAGAIVWARQLLRHIKEPMDKFKNNESVINNIKNSKKIIRTYNKVSIALLEYEAIWIDAWNKSIDSSKAGLNATLLVRSEGRLYVNFDMEILQLINETKSIMRLGDIPVPLSAKTVLFQEQKMKSVYNELQFLVLQYESIVGTPGDYGVPSKVLPITRSVLQPHLEKLDEVIRPGEVAITWTSMNIDNYFSSIKEAISQLDTLVCKINDMIQHRIQTNLRLVSSTLLVNLYEDHYNLDQFVAVQEKHIELQSELMNVKNKEIEIAVDDLINLVVNSTPEEIPYERIVSFKAHFNRVMFKAILTTTIRSLNLIKKRVGTRNRISFMFVDKPFFDVQVHLINMEPYVVLHPSLDEVQKVINRCATAVLRCSKLMTPWKGLREGDSNFFLEIAKNKEIVKVVLLLTGGIYGLKKQVNEYLNHFRKYEYLCRNDKETAYEKFAETNPDLDAYEREFNKFVDLSQDIEGIASTFNIGSINLNAEPLKVDFRKKIEEWSEFYARNLHTKAQKELDGLFHEMEEEERKLSQPIPDQEKLEDLRVMMDTLKKIRGMEATADTCFTPVQQAYTILQRFGVDVEKEELDRAADLTFKWKKLHTVAGRRTEDINGLQHGFKKGLSQEVQKFGVDVIAFRNNYEAVGPMVEGLKPQEAMDRLKRYQRIFDDKFRKWKTYMAGEALFGMKKHLYPELVKTKEELELLDKLYTLYINVLQKVNGYNDILWVELDFDKVVEEVNGFMVQCRRLPRSLRDWDAYVVLKKILDDFIELQPLIKELKNPAIQQRHWDEIAKLADRKLPSNQPDIFKLQNIVDADMLRFKEEVIDIASSSAREADVEKRFSDQVAAWQDTELKFAEFKHRGPIILKGDDAAIIKETLEESSLAINSMLSSRYCTFMREKIHSFLTKLVRVSETIGLWMEVQFTWMYLEAVFAGGDIMKQLPQETKRFAIIDKQWQKIMNKANELPNVLNFCYENELLDNLPALKDQLDECQRKLSLYLEQKRNLFPRFYFVSDTVLLEILSQASDPRSILPHLSSIYDGIGSVEFERVKPKTAGVQPYEQIIEMESGEGERLKMREPMPCVGHVEEWLNRLCAGMCATVKDVVKNCVGEIQPLRQSVDHLDYVINNYSAQITLLILQFLWTSDVTEFIMTKNRVGKIAKDNKSLIAATSAKIEGVKKYLVDMCVSPILEQKEKRFRTNVETLITIQVHQEEVFMTLKKVNDITSFDWLRQVRFYYRQEKDVCIISIADTDTEYCNEYIGVKERLVITPLTDRCYFTLSQALAMYMGGAPAGPAGTGKTETTKDLARTYGKFCVVMNCSDQLDRVAMGKIIRGLCQSNAWGCFDEFNRIDLPVLSVVAQQVNCALQALKQHKDKFIFIDGQITDLKPGVGFFITMNPGYAGRQELPENLKILFRGVTMMVPDRQAIMKVKLASQGYMSNDILAKKFFVLYKLCEEQLSKQRHYDFGLRNILSVLRTAGSVLRANKDKSSHGDPNEREEALFMRTLRDMNLSKLVFEDISLFKSLLKDMFPKQEDVVSNDYPDIAKHLDNVIRSKGLFIWPDWRLKIVQLYETKLVRHGIMVVGPALCGKTQCYNCMTDTLSLVTSQQQPRPVIHQQLRMNPKAITAPQMFGRMDAATGDWHDGVFSSLWRTAVRNAKKKNIWIVCDGPVDAIWIENLNTVLDDNKLLTLANGDRIQMTETMKACFEVENLANASPATVSRAGIIYISDIILGWRPVINSVFNAFINDTNGSIFPSSVKMRCNSQISEKLLQLFLPKGCLGSDETTIDRLYKFYTTECDIVMKTSLAHICLNAFHLCVALGEEVSKEDGSASDELVKKIFWWSAAWAFGGMLETKHREKLDTFIRGEFNGLPQQDNIESNELPRHPLAASPTSTSSVIFDYKINCKTGSWEHWNKFTEKWKYPGDDKLDFARLFIPTMDSTRLHYLLQCCFIQECPTLLIGVSGTAKTVTIEKFLLKVKDINPKYQDTIFKKTNFSSMTTPQNFYNALGDMVEKQMGMTYGPKGGGSLTIFIDDINMPEINEWGDQITNEIVRQAIELNEIYDLGKPGMLRILKGLSYTAAMCHPSGGWNDIPNRLKRHFFIANVPLPEEASIQQIFGEIFHGRFGSNYPQDIQEVAGMLTKLTIDFWIIIAKKMLPTPDKFHYFFNLRDLANVTQGMMLVGMFADPDNPKKRSESKPWEIIKDSTSLIRIWKHECTRVFSDKLNSVSDKKWFDANIQETIHRFFTQTTSYKDLPELTKEPVYLVNFLRDPILDENEEIIESAPVVYEMAPSMTLLRDRITQFLDAHNMSPQGRVKKLDLVLFDAAIKHVCRISRVLVMPRGNMMLVGVGGSGKQSLTRLATFLSNHNYASLTLSSGFGVNQLFDAIREQYMNASTGKCVTMLFTDADIKQESFLEYINSFLSNGEISGLFASDQRDSVINDMRVVARKDPMVKMEDTTEWMWNYFISRVRERLHFVLCFSPVGDKFRTRARKFPALISTCVIDWFFPWPPQALLDVSERAILNFKMEANDKIKTALRDFMASVHQLMLERSEDYFNRYRRSVYSTPKSYLSFISAYTNVYEKKFQEVNEDAKKINNGLKKLHQANEDVRVMRVQLQEKEVLLQQKRKETEILVKEVEIRTNEADKQRIEVQKVKETVARDAAIVAMGEAEAQRDLAAAEPTLLRAIEALNSITAADFTTLKKLINPPALIKRIFDGVSILLQSPLTVPQAEMVPNKGIWISDSWDLSGKALATNAETLAILKRFGESKKDLINEETCEILLPYLWMPEFTREAAKNACGNVAGLCTWVRSMYEYINIAKVVAPKKEKLRIAQIELRAANKKKEQQEQALAKVTAEVERYNKQFEDENAKKLILEEDAANTKRRMDSANHLIEALAGERDRWTLQSNEFRSIIDRLVGDVALSCAFISYCGPFNAEFRELLLNKYFYSHCRKLAIPVTENLDVVKFLVSETTIADWRLEGLPADTHSVQNAIMITTSSKWPLMIDPQGQAIQWIRKRTEAENSKICQQNDKNFVHLMQTQLATGSPLIVENLPESVDPLLDPILDKLVTKTGKGNLLINVHDQEMDYDPNFTFFMTTKLPNPSFAPELFAKCLVIDFTVTMHGLEQQLLNQVIGLEKAELNEESTKLSEEINKNEKDRRGLEDMLLKQLSESQGNLIDDVTLIETLQKTKSSSAEIKEKLMTAMETRQRIQTACEEYRPVAIRGAVLYFLVVEMSLVNPMYQTSLPQFLNVFIRSVENSEWVAITAKRIINIINYFTLDIFSYIVRGLFSKHKLLFVLLMACKIQMRAKLLNPESFDALLKGSAGLMTDKSKPALVWIKEKVWQNVCAISEQCPHSFRQLPEYIAKSDPKSDSGWKVFMEQDAPEKCIIPDFNDRLSSFDRLLLVRAVREDRTMLAASIYVDSVLGKEFSEPQQLDIFDAIDKSKGTEPIVFLLSQGSDPTALIEVAAKKIKRKVVPISMGQGQESGAKAIVEHSWNVGDWALLQNCHLGLPFLHQLEDMIRAVIQVHPGEKPREIHEESRIWITAEPHPAFPIELLQVSTKLTNEPPQGIKAGLIRTYSWLSQDYLELFRRTEWKPLMFTQCFLHSVVVERRKFGPIGFTVPYEFNQGDWTASLQFLINHMTNIGEEDSRNCKPVSWETIRYMEAEIQYGGRITDNYDRLLFSTITAALFDPKIVPAKNQSQDHIFYFSKGYGIPRFDDINKHRQFIYNTYPDVDEPYAFYMHSNTDITYRTRQTQECLATIVDIQPRQAVVAGGLSREDRVLTMTEDFLRQLPAKWNPDRGPYLKGKLQSLCIFCGQEIDRLSVTINTIIQTCVDLKLAVAGTTILTPALSDALDSLSDARVPHSWVAVGWPSPNISLWFNEILCRLTQLNNWSLTGLPASFWLAGFFNPQGFLTSVRQEISRKNEWALDKVQTMTEIRTTDFRPLELDARSKADGSTLPDIHVSGLFLEGATWDRINKVLKDAPKGDLFKEMPLVLISAQLQAEPGQKPTAPSPLEKLQKGPKVTHLKYMCPVYKYPVRTDTNFIFSVDLPCDEGDAFWRMRGAALLGSID